MRAAPFALAAICLAAASAHAQGIDFGKHDTNAPISVVADAFTGDLKTKVGTYSGNVIVSQGDIKLRADRVKVHVNDGKPERIEATGHVVLDSPGSGTASGDDGVYELSSRTVTLNGHVVLAKDKNVMRGTQLAVNLDSGQATLRAQGSQGGRVQGLFVPQQTAGGGKKATKKDTAKSGGNGSKP